MLEPEIKDKQRWWHREDLLLLVMLAALFLLPGLHQIPLFDRDEPRFAVAARNMLETGDFIVPRFNGALRPDKPPLVYWLMDIGYTLTGGAGELGARLPSAICATLTLIVVYFMAGGRFGRLTGFISAMMLGSCVMFVTWGRLATADATMLLFITVCMHLAWRAWEGMRGAGEHTGLLARADFLLDRGSERTLMLDHMPEHAPQPLGWLGAMLFWAALAGGALTKGVPLLFVLVPMVALSVATKKWGWWRSLRPLVGVPLLLVLVGWWVVLAGQATEWKLIRDMVQEHFYNRVAGGSEGMKHYGAPPGFFAATVWPLFWPWSILIVPAAFHTIRRVRGKLPIAIDRRPYQFLLAWIVPMWILLEASWGKLVHYSLPLMVPLAILCADALVQSWHRLTDVLAAKWFATLRWVVLVIWLGMGIGLVAVASRHPDPSMMWRCLPFAACLMATGAVGAVTWGRPSWPYVLALAWGGSLMVCSVMLLADLPELQVSRVASQQMVEARHQEPRTRYGVLGYEEATLVFYSGSAVRRFGSVQEMLKEVPFGTADAAEKPWVVVVSDAFRAEMDRQGISYNRVPRVDLPANLQVDAFAINGFNPANASMVAVSVIGNLPGAPPATTTHSSPSAPTERPRP